MADESLLVPSRPLIADRYAVDTSQVLADAGGGVPAYLARDRMAADGKRAALAVSRTASPRMEHLKTLNEPIDGLMVPLGHGIASMAGGKGEGYFVICPMPPGPALSAGLTVWSEKSLIEYLLRPVAAVLDALHVRKLTYRAIRPNNVFQGGPGQPVTLGGAAWAAPPAMHQPTVFESPYNAMCHPAGRGDGVIADDIYSLGVLLLTLSSGRVPMAGLSNDAIIRWKLEVGSFAALSRDAPMSGFIADLLRVMLAEDPEHRPLPSMLMDLVQSRGRRVAARPARRGQNPLMFGEQFPIFDSRTLAWALFNDQKKAIQFLRNGQLTQWLRRGLGDAGLATQVEELIRARAAEQKPTVWSDPLLVMHTITVLNPRMPLCWRGLALWPDSLPSMLAEGTTTDPELLVGLEELLLADIFDSWNATDPRAIRPDPGELLMQRQLLSGGGPNGLLRLFYWMNPVLPCRVPAMAGSWVSTMFELMRWFERSAETAGESLIDAHIAAFIAARGDRKTETQATAMSGIKDRAALRTAELALLRHMQTRYHPEPMPALAKWVGTRLRPEVDRWRNKPRRLALHARLDASVQTGMVGKLLDLTTDPAAWAADVSGLKRATYALALIDEELAAIDDHDHRRSAHNERFGEAIVGGIGLSALILTVMSVMLR